MFEVALPEWLNVKLNNEDQDWEPKSVPDRDFEVFENFQRYYDAGFTGALSNTVLGSYDYI